MKNILLYSLLGALIIVPRVYAYYKNRKKPPVKKVSFEEQLETFRSLGLELNDGITQKDLLDINDREDYEDEPWELLYTAMGEENDDDLPLSDNLFYCDGGFIEFPGDYITIVRNMGRISNGELLFTNIRDHVDIAGKSAWVSFDLNGENYKYDLKVEHDKLDTALLDKIQELAEKYNTKGGYTLLRLDYDGVIGYLDEEKLHELNGITGLKIEWLRGFQIKKYK